MDDLWSEAIKEAYTRAPSSEVILHTIELRHSGLSAPIRLVRDHGTLIASDSPPDPTTDIYGHMLTLEVDAPVDAGASVLFQAVMFDFFLPGQQDTPPSVNVSFDNIMREISEQLDSLIGYREPIELTYREYLDSDHTQPQFILPGLTIAKVDSDLHRSVATATFHEVINKNFPGILYRVEDYPGLAT
jgi:hypothetical protein